VTRTFTSGIAHSKREAQTQAAVGAVEWYQAQREARIAVAKDNLLSGRGPMAGPTAAPMAAGSSGPMPQREEGGRSETAAPSPAAPVWTPARTVSTATAAGAGTPGGGATTGSHGVAVGASSTAVCAGATSVPLHPASGHAPVSDVGPTVGGVAGAVPALLLQNGVGSTLWYLLHAQLGCV
jgi:hypothetical protein